VIHHDRAEPLDGLMRAFVPPGNSMPIDGRSCRRFLPSETGLAGYMLPRFVHRKSPTRTFLGILSTLILIAAKMLQQRRGGAQNFMDGLVVKARVQRLWIYLYESPFAKDLTHFRIYLHNDQ